MFLEVGTYLSKVNRAAFWRITKRINILATDGGSTWQVLLTVILLKIIKLNSEKLS
jgi:hypothetical protein